MTLTASPPVRGRSWISASEGGAVAGADVQPAVMASGGTGESSWRTAGQCSAHPGCDGRDAAPQAEVTVFFFSQQSSAGSHVRFLLSLSQDKLYIFAAFRGTVAAFCTVR